MKLTAKKPLAIVLALLPATLVSSPLRALDEGGFVSLVNGKDLSGWINVNGALGTWTVRDGMIICTGKPICVLRTERQYENFILELEWKHVHPKGNSGCFVWSDPLPARGQPFTRAIEVQILDGTETANYTSHGDVFAIHGAVMTPDRPHPGGWMRCLPSEKRSHPAGEWNQYRIVCKDGAVKLSVNGKEVSGGYDINPRKGYICLESEGSEVHFRNVKVKELAPSGDLKAEQIARVADVNVTCLYNGLDLAGWKLGPKSTEHWIANDWVIDADGLGEPLVSGKEYEDFILMADWRWTGKAQKRRVPVILKNGTHELGADGKEKLVEIDDAGEAAIQLRSDPLCDIRMSCWPAGSGEVRGYRANEKMPRDVRTGATPNDHADEPIGEWNRFVITMRGERLSVDLNKKVVIENAKIPDAPRKGPIAIITRGSPIQLANIIIHELK